MFAGSILGVGLGSTLSVKVTKEEHVVAGSVTRTNKVCGFTALLPTAVLVYVSGSKITLVPARASSYVS